MGSLYVIHPVTGERARVSKEAYITAKWKDLREFGYTSLTRETVVAELDNLLTDKPVSVIGEFMRGDIHENQSEEY